MKKASLKKILILSFFILAIFPIGILSILIFETLGEKLETEILNKNQLLAQSVSSQIDEFLAQPKNMIKRIALLARTKKIINEDKILDYLNAYIETYPYFENILVLSPNGKIRYISPYDRNYLGIDLSRQNFYISVLEKKRVIWSPVFISQQNGQPTVAIAQMSEDGFVIVGYLNLRFLNAIIHKFYAGKEVQVGIVDDDGNLIAHSNVEYVNQRTNIKNLKSIRLGALGNQITLEEKFENIDHLVSVDMVHATGWVVGVFEPSDEAFSTIRITGYLMLAGILIALFFWIGISYWSLKKILRSIRSFEKESKKIADGDYVLEPEKVSLIEFQGLANGFETMSKKIAERERDLKDSNEKLEELLKENKILFREVHHRVKNNLQIVSSLLSLQASYVKDENVLKILKEARARIQSIALVHQKIYQNDNFTDLNFKNYMDEMASYLVSSFSMDLKNIEIVKEIEPVVLDLDTTIYLSMIINELIINSYKYAFQNNNGGKITIKFYSDSQKHYVLIVSDNGIGLPESVDFKNPKTLGLDLVMGLTESLSGTIEVQRNQGTTFLIRFKKKA